MSIWIFHLFGGIRVSGDAAEPDAMTRVVGGVTASQRVLRLLDDGQGSDSPTAA
ncbi:hypothetical protein [Bradyrhizobium sp. USDA 4369]